MTASEVGVRYPFSVSGGSVVTTSNQTDLITSRVVFCLGTQVGERVMNPGWGTDIMKSAFELEGASTQEIVRDAIKNAFRKWFPNSLQVRKITFPPNPDNRNVVLVDVTFGNYAGGSDTTVRTGIPTNGAEIYGNEGPR